MSQDLPGTKGKGLDLRGLQSIRHADKAVLEAWHATDNAFVPVSD